jgi:tetratricopeptide (TPR) repeat protein
MTKIPALLAGGLRFEELPTTGERPALVLQAQALAREQGARLVAWPRWDMAVLTPAAPPLGLVAGGLGLMLLPDELVVTPAQAGALAQALAALLERPAPETAQAALRQLAPLDTAEAALWRVVIGGWAAALTREWAQLEAALEQAAALAAAEQLPRAVRAGASLALGLLALEAGEPAGQCQLRFEAAAELFAQMGCEAPAALADWARAQALERQGLSEAALAGAEAAAQALDPRVAPEVAATLLAGLASLRRSRTGTLEEARAATAARAEALRICPEATSPLLCARLLASLGDAELAEAQGDADLRRALGRYERAAGLFERFGTPADLAAVHLSQGGAWQGLGGDTRGNLTRAIDCYQRALRTFTLAAYPDEYALLHNNLATAYLQMPPSGEREREIMRQAIAVQSLQEALKVYTLEEQPHEYAMVQNNLGNVLQYLPSGDPVEKLDRAIGAYHEALRVRSRPRAPLEYATTLSNLANAYANLPAEDRGEVLDLAARSYDEALEIFRAAQLEAQAQTVEQALEAVQRQLAALDAAADRSLRPPLSQEEAGARCEATVKRDVRV